MLVLIVGGSSGIGKHLAQTYLSLGHEVVIVADKKEKLYKAEKELAKISPKVKAFCCDIAQTKSVSKMAKAVLSSQGCPDILVNNAGFAVYRTFEQSSLGEIERLIQVNLLGALRCTHAFLPSMIKRRSGHIVNIASVAGMMPITPCAAYGAAKYGMVGMSEALRYELRDFNIKVQLVCPGRVDTPFFEHETFQKRPRRSETEKTVPIERVSKGIIRAIEKNNFYTVIPWSLGVAIWLRCFMPKLFDLFLERLLLNRIREVRSLNL